LTVIIALLYRYRNHKRKATGAPVDDLASARLNLTDKENAGFVYVY